MKLTTRRVIKARPQDLWPLFFEAKMDDRVPFIFRFGLPKAVSCSIIDGDGSPGSTRRCITTRGYMDQTIDHADNHQRFVYHLVDSNYWGQPFIDHVSDDIRIYERDAKTIEVVRETDFGAKTWLAFIATPIMYLGFVFAHRYAHQNWARIAQANMDADKLELESAGQIAT